ncbi:MAG: hypothetical protein AAF337_07545 [Pseudomonadota bacterium]
MAELVFEIWGNEHGSTLLRVGQQSDELRLLEPEPLKLLHTFTACSVHEAFQKNNDFLGFGIWDSGDTPDVMFTDLEAEEQRLYLSKRVTD